MTRINSLILAVVVLLVGGVVHGLSSERWRSSQVLEDAAAHIDRVPMRIGDWQGRNEPDDDEEFDQAGARRHWTRIYTHDRTQQALRVILMCGRAGRMSVHTPQMCYRGAGYEMPEDPMRFSIDDKPSATFWTAMFTKPGVLGSDLRLFWAWNVSGAWESAQNPRWQYRGQPFLYKLYVAHDLQGASDAGPARDAGAQFLHDFIPQVEQVLFPPPREVT
jgi:hypothetical protein